MSELLISWLNDEVQLSKRIANFEQDFHNGYLFGELLSKYSQQLNFDQFIDKDDKASRINNFTLLYDTFKTLRVSYDSNIAMNIIEKKTGVAKKVLYELKMQLEKTTSSAFNKLTKTTKPLSPLKKIPVPKQKFDKISKGHFNKQLNELHQAQKVLNLEEHLQKYPEFYQKQLEKAEVEEKKQTQARLLGQIKFREKQLENIKKSSQFRNDWEQSNVEKWANNMAVRKLQQEKDNTFKATLQNTKIQNKTLSELSAIKSLDKDLKQFEKRAGKKKDDSDSSNEKDQKIQTQQPMLLKKTSQKPKNEIGFGVSASFDNASKLSATGQLDEEPRRKKNPQDIQTTRHQREKRRRKMIVEQSKKHQLIKIDRREKYIMSTLQQTSKQEKQIEYEIWRAWQNKQIIVQNKNSQNDKIKEKDQIRAINSKFKDDQLIKAYRQEHQKQLSDGMERQNKLKIHNSVKQRKKMYDECKSIIESVISMTEVVYSYGQQTNKEELNEVFMTHLFDQFVQSANSKKQIAELELSNYIHGKGQWDIQIKRDGQDQPIEPTEDNSLPNSVINNYYVGNILKTVFSELYEPHQQIKQGHIKHQNLISILGLEFSGKNITSDLIKDKLGFNTVSIPQLVQNKLKEYESLASKGIQVQSQTAQLVDLCYSGKTLPTKLMINLIKQNVQKNPKTILVNFPITYEECIELTKAFGKTEPSDYSQKSKLSEKIAQFSRLVWPSETTIVKRSLKSCGLDLAVWIDIQPKTSLDRFLGRRWTPQGQVIHVNDEISNPNTLSTGDKASSTIYKNNFKLKNKKKIQDWLNQFGIRITENEQEFVQKCWESVSGQCSIDELKMRVFEVINKNLQIKNKYKRELDFAQQKHKDEARKQKQALQLQEQIKKKCVFSTADLIKQKFKKAVNQTKMDKVFLDNIEKVWNNTQKLTISGFLSIFQSLREQEEAKNRHISTTKLNFLRMLTREDQRFYLVKKFQIDYNKFFDQSNDMIVQSFTKEELHQRIEDLELELLTLIEQKKEDAIAQRQNIIKSGWLENQLDQVMSSIHILLQIQLNRSLVCQQIIADFYSKKYSISTGEVQDPPNELNLDAELEIVKENSFPRLEKLVTEAMRLFNREEEVVDDKNKKGGKAPPPKKDDKKQAKKGGKDQPQQKVELTSEQKQYKKAINTEKAIFRYRVKVISAFAVKKIKMFQETGLKLYTDLQDLYKYTDKVENRSVIQMTKIFKKSIQSQTKIENQVSINYTQILQSELIRNFKKPKPVILAAVQTVQGDRFTISGMKQLIRAFKSESQAGISIKNNRLLTLLQELSINQRYRTILPQKWKQLTKKHHQKFISQFDRKSKGEIQLWIIFTVIALSNVQLPSEGEMKQYELQITEHNPLTKEVDQIRIAKSKSWFDSTEPSQSSTRYFDRNKYLKQILFEIFKKEDGTQKVAVDKYLNKIAFSEFRNLKQQISNTYLQYAFALGKP